jgi:hypothetical protein
MASHFSASIEEMPEEIRASAEFGLASEHLAASNDAFVLPMTSTSGFLRVFSAEVTREIAITKKLARNGIGFPRRVRKAHIRTITLNQQGNSCRQLNIDPFRKFIATEAFQKCQFGRQSKNSRS